MYNLIKKLGSFLFLKETKFTYRCTYAWAVLGSILGILFSLYLIVKGTQDLFAPQSQLNPFLTGIYYVELMILWVISFFHFVRVQVEGFSQSSVLKKINFICWMLGLAFIFLFLNIKSYFLIFKNNTSADSDIIHILILIFTVVVDILFIHTKLFDGIFDFLKDKLDKLLAKYCTRI